MIFWGYSVIDDLKYGIYLANYGPNWNVKEIIVLAKLAEKYGWEGFFLWDHICRTTPEGANVLDPWVVLTAIASHTKKIRLGTTVTPLARRQPWYLAKQTATLDQLSNGRVTLGVGLGSDAKEEFEPFGLEGNAKIRAQKLDESLEILQGLWSGEKFSYNGEHYKITERQFLPKSQQQPTIPIWVGGTWPNKPPFRRAARYDGVFPLRAGFGKPLTPDDYRAILTYIQKYRTVEKPLDVIFTTYFDVHKDFTKILENYSKAGVNWFFECLDPWRGKLEDFKKIITTNNPKNSSH
ncbi:MAG: LLM class flavin-dependent oxidoreductase [Candidatus Heimdallarchaeota archaeon]|nr:LLM class flavin-dependent oxidoreductase [Candidatus Heimdallarchaeota archaeon]